MIARILPHAIVGVALLAALTAPQSSFSQQANPSEEQRAKLQERIKELSALNKELRQELVAEKKRRAQVEEKLRQTNQELVRALAVADEAANQARVQRARVEEALREAEAQRARAEDQLGQARVVAEERFEMAKEAVQDYLMDIEARFDDAESLEAVRDNLLDSAQEFYGEVVAQFRDNELEPRRRVQERARENRQLQQRERERRQMREEREVMESRERAIRERAEALEREVLERRESRARVMIEIQEARVEAARAQLRLAENRLEAAVERLGLNEELTELRIAQVEQNPEIATLEAQLEALVAVNSAKEEAHNEGRAPVVELFEAQAKLAATQERLESLRRNSDITLQLMGIESRIQINESRLAVAEAEAQLSEARAVMVEAELELDESVALIERGREQREDEEEDDVEEEHERHQHSDDHEVIDEEEIVIDIELDEIETDIKINVDTVLDTADSVLNVVKTIRKEFGERPDEKVTDEDDRNDDMNDGDSSDPIEQVGQIADAVEEVVEVIKAIRRSK